MPEDSPPSTPLLPRFRLCDLGVALKLGLSGLVLVLLGGFVASAAQLKFHHENRDEVPGVSLNDIRGAYRGVEIRAPLLTALERGHPSGLSPDDRKVLVDWLNAGRISVDYDNLDLGDRAPAEIIARDCVSCHSEKAAATQPAAARVPLDTFDQVKRVAFTKKLDPPPVKILAQSTHAHALSLGVLTFIIAGLLLCTRLPRALTHGSCMLMGLCLAADIAAWWIVRDDIDFARLGMHFHLPTAWFIYVIVGAGTVYNGLSALSLVAIFLDAWIPRFRRNA
jgi:hypothetical protein